MVKFGKKFFFNNTYIKKNRTFTIVVILVILSLILTTFFVTSQFYNGSTNNNTNVVEPYEKININLFDNLPYMLSYFKTLENVKVSDIKIVYPDNFSYLEDTTNCTEEQITIINGIKTGEITDVNIDEAFSCMVYKIRRCTGFKPSRTSGSARATMTDIEYCRKDFFISLSKSMLSTCARTSSSCGSFLSSIFHNSFIWLDSLVFFPPPLGEVAFA